MGSKARIVHEILPIMLDKEHDTFVSGSAFIPCIIQKKQ